MSLLASDLYGSPNNTITVTGGTGVTSSGQRATTSILTGTKRPELTLVVIAGLALIAIYLAKHGFSL